MITAVILLAAILLIALLKRKRRSLNIYGPVVGILDLGEGCYKDLVQSDILILEALFGSVVVSEDIVPVCDLLFLYAKVERDGGMQGKERYMRATIRESGATVVILANDNGPECVGSGKHTYGRANLVVILQRNGAAFGNFMRCLFTKMSNGATMQEAWVELVPQSEFQGSEKMPVAIFLAEVGGVRFVRRY